MQWLFLLCTGRNNIQSHYDIGYKYVYLLAVGKGCHVPTTAGALVDEVKDIWNENIDNSGMCRSGPIKPLAKYYLYVVVK